MKRNLKYELKQDDRRQWRERINEISYSITMAVQDTIFSMVKPEIVNQAVKVFPNPSNGLVNVFIGKNDSNTNAVVDMYGRIMYLNKYTSDYEEIDLGNLSTGIYLLKANNRTVQKVAIQ